MEPHGRGLPAGLGAAGHLGHLRQGLRAAQGSARQFTRLLPLVSQGIVLLKAGQSPWARLGSLSRVLNPSTGGNLDALSSGMACDAQQMAFQTLKCFILVKHALTTVIAAGTCVPAM